MSRLGGLAIVALLLAGPSARAQSPTDNPSSEPDAHAPPLELPPLRPRLALMGGYGFESDNRNLRGLGAGLRAGTHFGDRGLYVGGTLVQFAGSRREFETIYGTAEQTYRMGYGGIELGYEIRLGSTVIVPWGGLGVAWLASKVCLPAFCSDRADETGLQLFPSTGVSVYQHFGSLFVGADGRIFPIGLSDDTGSAYKGGLAAFAVAGCAP
jgi:hypothetical protein